MKADAQRTNVSTFLYQCATYVDRCVSLNKDDVEPPWPDYRHYFEYPRDNEDLFYPSYTRLLYALFSANSHYNVVRRFPSNATTASEGSKRFGTALVVEVQNRPVFFVDIEPSHPRGYTATRTKLMKSKFQHLSRDRFMDVLYGVSAHGSGLYFYKYVPKTDTMSMDPDENGNYGDLLDGPGLGYLRATTERIKERVNNKLQQ